VLREERRKQKARAVRRRLWFNAEHAEEPRMNSDER
jgi:hypothetical protein